MDYKPKERSESEIVDYKRIFYGGTDDNDNAGEGRGESKASRKKEREKRFMTVFLVQLAVCLALLSTALVLKYTRPDTFETVSSVLNGFYENNITLSDLNQLLDERIANSDALATFFNFFPAED